MPSNQVTPEDRVIALGDGLPLLPERLLLAHARGHVLFVCGAGISRASGLPDFRELVVAVYGTLDPAVHKALISIPRDACSRWETDFTGLTNNQIAEVKRFINGDFDVTLGMLERRLEDRTRVDSRVRIEVARLLRSKASKAASTHRALMKLAERGGTTTIITTNFDLLLEAAARQLKKKIDTYALGSIPRPTRQTEFSGVLHIHGALDPKPSRLSELILSDQDFGEHYLLRRGVPDFIYDAARLFNLVLIGYSANDPPMRYLLNAVAADVNRFDDLKERFTFFGSSTSDEIALEDWRGRGITPIEYKVANGSHDALLQTLEKWSDFSASSGKPGLTDKTIRRIVKLGRRSEVTDLDRDLFDHLVRRANDSERRRLAGLASSAGADTSWLDTIINVSRETLR